MIPQYRSALLSSKQSGSTVRNTFKPPKTQKSTSLTKNLKEVFLRDIDFTKDHVLNDHKINVTIIEDPLQFFSGFSVDFVIEDKFKFVERMAIYNLGDDYESIFKKFAIGSKFLIINPYIRMANDGKPMIRISDPSSIKSVDLKVEKMCRFCGNGNSKFNCSKCLKALYCSKECQTNDWKLLNHKLICI